MRYGLFAGALALAMLPAAAVCADYFQRPDGHAPIGVMGDHLHRQGEWMAAYKYEYSHSSDLRSGSRRVSDDSVLAVYGEAATAMGMEMHMFELMYGVTDDLTVMVMPQYMRMSMTHRSAHGGGHSHEHKVESFGDSEVTGLYSLYRGENEGVRHRAHANLGLNLPTGSIGKTFTDHHDTLYRLPYNMQFGSGTFDPIIGATYTGASPDWSWGAQTLNYLRVGKNDAGYRQGHKYTVTAWLARNLTGFVSLSFRLEGEAWGNVSGRDAGLPPTVIAGADPDEQAGERLLAHAGLNLLAGGEQGVFAGHRLAAELGMPLYERYSGPQSATDYRLTLGWQWAF